MRSAFRFLMLSGMMLAAAAASAQNNINPHTQIRWPVNCSGPHMFYNYATNLCVVTADVTGVVPGPPALCANGTGGALTSSGCTIPAPQVSWPASCATGTYVPATNTCVPTGTAANPGGTTNQVQFNGGGGTFGADATFTYNPATRTLALGGITTPAGFGSGTIASPGFYSPNAAVDVMVAGAKGDCVTDDHDAIERAIAAALAANSNNPLPLIFPQPPGGCYLTSTLTWQSVSMRGLDTGITPFGTGGTSISLRSKPGQDLWLYPDPNDVNTVINKTSVRVENLQFVVDNSIDTEARTGFNGVTTSGSPTLTSATFGFLSSDTGKFVTIFYPDGSFQVATITYVSATQVTMSVNANETKSSVAIYIEKDAPGHPHRKPGRTLTDAVTNSTTTVTSATVSCGQGDVGQYVALTYPDASVQYSTMTACNNNVTTGAGGNTVTLANAATQSQSGVKLYVSFAGLAPTETIGNCALAIDNRDQDNFNWIDHNLRYPFSASIFRNLSFNTTAGGKANHTGSVCLQGQLGSGYGDTFEHIRITGGYYGFMKYPADTNPTISNAGGRAGSSQGCDFCRYLDWNDSAAIPLVIFNGGYQRIADIQQCSAIGPQFLGVLSFWDGPIGYSEISIPEQECTSYNHGFRLEGSNNIVRNTGLEGSKLVWGASNSRCEMCTARGGVAGQGELDIYGVKNTIQLMGSDQVVTFVNADPSNHTTAYNVTSASFNTRPYAIAPDRNSIAGIRSADFLKFGSNYFNNLQDLWLIPQDIGWNSGVLYPFVADPTSESGWYAAMTAGAYADYWRSLTGTGIGYVGNHGHPVIGGPTSVVPATTMKWYARVKCPSLTSFGTYLYIRRISDNGVQATISLLTQPCSTSYTTVTNTVDLSAYGGGLYFMSPGYTFSGEVDLAWEAWAPASSIPAPSLTTLGGVNSKACAAGQHVSTVGTDGSITCTADSGGNASVPQWLQFYGDGSEGAYAPGGTVVLEGEHWYSSVNIAAGVVVRPSHTYPLIIRSTGTCTIAGSLGSSINLGAGGTGGNGYWAGSGGGGGGGTAAGTAGSNGFTGLSSDKGTAGTAGGGAGGTGPGTVAANANFQKVFLSQGFEWLITPPASSGPGGAQGGAGGSTGGAGGVGGGLVVLVCPTIAFTGTIDASGGAGGASTGNNIGGGGGGGGGIVIMRSPALTNSGTINTSAGTGGSCGAFTGCGAGGTGGAGWSAVFAQ